MLNGIKIAQENENRKIWRREWRYQKLGRENDFSIPFEYKTTVWPDIEMFDVEEKDFRFNAVNLLNCDKEISPESSSDFVMHWAL